MGVVGLALRGRQHERLGSDGKRALDGGGVVDDVRGVGVERCAGAEAVEGGPEGYEAVVVVGVEDEGVGVVGDGRHFSFLCVGWRWSSVFGFLDFWGVCVCLSGKGGLDL